MADTHYPGSDGPICGLHRDSSSQRRIPVPTDARSYDVDSPTCPDCQRWLAGLRRQPPNPSRLDAPKPKTKPAPPPEE